MAEYIERNYIRKMAMFGMAYMMETKTDTAVVLRMIDDAPAADAVPVVRCKNCTGGIMSDDNKYIICCRLGVGMEFNDFCSYGERKNEGDGCATV